MKKLLLILLLLSASLLAFSRPEGDIRTNASEVPARFAHLDSLLLKFYAVMDVLSIDEKCEETDFLISTATDSLTRQHIALSVFDHFRDSKIMGDEAVSVYVYDKWFASGKTAFLGEMERLDAEVFVRFNRQSLIGCEAPELVLRKPCCGKRTLPVKGHTSVIFFFDTQCEKCRIVAGLLPQILDKVDFKLDFYAVYCGAQRREWAKFRRSFRLHNRKVKLYHLWDPELDSDYPLKYAVTGTPRIYCIEPQGMIIGRRLEADSLVEMLQYAGAIQATYDRFVSGAEDNSQ